MTDPQRKPVTAQRAFELAALRNTPLSVVRPQELGRSPMARGRFLAPQDGTVLIENLQIPGRSVGLKPDQVIEAYFQQDGEIYHFRSRILEMDTPVRLNDTTVVRGMKILAPASIDRGNRRSIYRQSFAVVNPPVDVSVWAVPLDMLTDEQRGLVTPGDDEDHGPGETLPGPGPAPGGIEGFRVERGERTVHGLPNGRTLLERIDGLTLGQLDGLPRTAPHWKGEIADASEFGIGLTVRRVVYSRLKVFQPLVIRFRLPDSPINFEFLLEVRRVQGLGGTDARLGGLLLINAANHNEVHAARELARFTLEMQRERARRLRDAG